MKKHLIFEQKVEAQNIFIGLIDRAVLEISLPDDDALKMYVTMDASGNKL